MTIPYTDPRPPNRNFPSKKLLRSMTHEQHVEWAKGRALYYTQHGECEAALGSLVHDFLLRDSLKEHPAPGECLAKLAMQEITTPEQMAAFIEGITP